MTSKPRLKLHTTGRVTVVANGELGWSSANARSFIKQHYGSVTRFATRFGLSYAAACVATEPGRDWLASRQAGDVAQVRALLGLPSSPTEISRRLANAHAERRAKVPA